MRSARPTEKAGLLPVAALALAPMLGGCAGAGLEEDVVGCMPEPTLFEWQMLREDNLLVWLLPPATPYNLVLAEPVPELVKGEAAIQLIDGNSDGLICDDGWDAVGLVAEPIGIGDAAAGVEEVAEIFLLREVDATAVENLRETHRETLGEHREVG